jgi:hypothetical protein
MREDGSVEGNAEPFQVVWKAMQNHFKFLDMRLPF